MASTERPSTPFCTGVLAALATAVSLGACSIAGPRESPLPKDGPNLIDVYREHIAMEGAAGKSPRDRLPLRSPDDDNAASQRRTDLSPLQQRFQRLPNPDLVMYVFPHLARGRYPVPGYVTVFPMYETVEYAMPGEAFERPAPARANARPPAASSPVAAAAAPKNSWSARIGRCAGEAGCSPN